MTALPVPGEGTIGALLLDFPERTMAAWTDRLVLDWSALGLGNHLWASSKTWDPEGVLSTVPAIGTAMLGNIAGRWIAQRRPLPERLAGLSAAGALAMMVGLMWHWVFPINKSLWTSSYVLFTAGMALARTRDDHVDRRPAEVAAVDETIRRLRRKSHHRVRGVRRARAVHLLDLQGHDRWQAHVARGGDLPDTLRILADADQCIARVCDRVRVVLVCDSLCAVPARHHPQGVFPMLWNASCLL